MDWNKQRLNRYDRSTDTFTRFSQNQTILKIYRDSQGEMWVGTNTGLWRLEPGSPEQQQPVLNRYGLDGGIITAIYEDHQGDLWVGTTLGGLNRLDRATGEFTRFTNNQLDPTTLSDNYVSSILEDDNGRLWVGTNNGLNLFDPATGGFFHYNNEPDDPYSLSNDAVIDLYQDRSGVVWIATPGGINKVNENASRFTHYQKLSSQPNGATSAKPASVLDPQSPPGLSENMLESVYEDSHGILWIGTVGAGLNRLDRKTGTVTVYRHDPTDPTSLSGDEVITIYEDQAGTLWIGSNGGLDRFKPQTGTFDYIGAFRDRAVSTIAEDQQGNLWVGYWGGVLQRERGKAFFSSIPPIGDMVYHNRVNKIYPDRTGAIWISTQENGLFRLDPAPEATGSNPTVIHFAQDASDPKSPGVGPVMSFYEDSAGEVNRMGTLWMG